MTLLNDGGMKACTLIRERRFALGACRWAESEILGTERRDSTFADEAAGAESSRLLKCVRVSKSNLPVSTSYLTRRGTSASHVG